jgi:hypothetical protein
MVLTAVPAVEPTGGDSLKGGDGHSQGSQSDTDS